MIVTPYLVKPVVAAARSPGPTTTCFMANDAEAYFLNRLTKVYGTEGQVHRRRLPARSASPSIDGRNP